MGWLGVPNSLSDSLATQVTAARCNHTHDSACAAATYPFAIMTIHQRFTTDMEEQFRVFAMVYASSVPRTQVVRFCDGRWFFFNRLFLNCSLQF